MSITISTAQANQILDALDATYNSGVLEIRSGAKPAGTNSAPSGTLLATGTLPADAFAAAAARSKSKQGTWTLTGVAAGTAGHFRMKTSSDGGGSSTTDARIDGDITATGGGGDLTLDNTSIAVAQAVTVGTLTLSI